MSLVPTVVTLDDLLALNREITALARAGVPLGPGLLEFGRDLPGRLGKLASSIGERLERGEPLEKILSQADGFPPAYRAVVQAGLRVGRLPAALEGISQSIRRTAQLRWTIGLAMVYPLIVMALSYGFFCWTLFYIAPIMLITLTDTPGGVPVISTAIEILQRTFIFWAPILPFVVIAWFAWLWWRAGQVAAGIELHPWLAFGAVSTMLKLRQAGRLAAMCDTLALLLEYGVPLHEAVPLAAQTTGGKELEKAAVQLATRLERGEQVGDPPKGFPPLLAWMLCGGQLRRELPQVLRRAAKVYRDEAARRAHWLRLYVPLFLTIAFGGGAVVLYSALTIGPYFLILRRLAAAAYP